MNNSANSNIFSTQIQLCLDQFADYVTGTPNDLVCCISAAPLSDAATSAIESSMEKIGYGRMRTSWVVLAGKTPCESTQPSAAQSAESQLTETQLHRIIETLDPNAIIITDSLSTALLQQAYNCTFDTRQTTARILGRPIAVLVDFENMLESSESKQRAWHALKTLALD